jgi:hypothetical protein
MSDLQKQKESISSDISKISLGIREAKNKYQAAITAGKDVEAQSYVDLGRNLYDKVKILQNQFSKLETEEEAPNLERISGLRKEIEKPIVAPMPNYMGMGGRGGVGMPRSYEAMYNMPSVEQQMATKRESIAQLFNAPVGEGGMAAEQLPTGVRFGVGALPTPESELEYLRQTYPDANITPMSVGGKTQFLIKTKDGKTFTTLDMGLAGFAGAAAVEAPIAIGSTAAGISAALATKSPMAGTATAAATEAGLGTVADMITRSALGMEQNIGENVARRGTQAAIGGALGAVGDVAIPAVRAFRVPSGTPNAFRQEFVESAERLGLPEAVPAGSQFGPKGIEGAQELAGDFPKSRLGGKLRTAQQDLVKKFDPFRKMATTAPGDYASVAQNLAQKRGALVTRIARNTDQNEFIVDGAVQRLLKPYRQANVDELGGILRGTVQQLDEQISNFTNRQYDLMSDLADTAGFSMTAQEMLDKIPQIRRELNFSGFIDDRGVKGLENSLRARRDAPIEINRIETRLKNLKKTRNSVKDPNFRLRLEGQIQDATNELEDLKAINRPLNFKDFNELVKSYGNLRSENLVGGSTKDIFGTNISDELSGLRSQIFKGYSTTDASGVTRNLADEFQKTALEVGKRNDMQKNTLGSILKEAGGENVATQRDVVRIAMKDPETMSRVLRAAQDLDATQPGIAKTIKDRMQIQYLNDIMGKEGNITQLNYEKGFLDTLFDADSGKVARGLDTLNEKLAAIKGVKISNITRDDLAALSSALSKRERDDVAEQIKKREILKAEEEKLVSSEIFEAAKNGNFENIDPDLISRAVLDGATTTNVEIAMAQLSKLSPDARNLYKGDFMRIFLDHYRGGTPTAALPNETLFDVDKFLVDYGSKKEPSELGKNINTILGADSGTALYDLAKLYQANTLKELNKTGAMPRVVASTRNVGVFYPIAKLTTSGRNRFLAYALANGSESNGVRSALARNALPGNVNDAYVKMFQSAFKTRQGLTFLAKQASEDPEFSFELEQAAKDFEEKERANSNSAFSELNRKFDLQRKQNLNSGSK